MAKIAIEDAVLFILSFYIICSVIFSFTLFDSYTPGQRYNPATSSFEPYTRNTASIFGSAYDINATLAKYNTTIIDPGAMLNPLAVVGLVGAYLALFTDLISSTMMLFVLKIFMGDALARVITMVLNICVFIVGIRIITGRVRWN